MTIGRGISFRYNRDGHAYSECGTVPTRVISSMIRVAGFNEHCGPPPWWLGLECVHSCHRQLLDSGASVTNRSARRMLKA